MCDRSGFRARKVRRVANAEDPLRAFDGQGVGIRRNEAELVSEVAVLEETRARMRRNRDQQIVGDLAFVVRANDVLLCVDLAGHELGLDLDALVFEQVAERLYVSERTLRRRLEAESTSFRAVFDEIRDLLAREYLAKTELTIADIAHLLDYAETVSFRRAFVRWNGITPSGYRQHNMAESIS